MDLSSIRKDDIDWSFQRLSYKIQLFFSSKYAAMMEVCMGKFLKRLMLNIYFLGEEVVYEAVAEENSNCQKCKQCLISIL